MEEASLEIHVADCSLECQEEVVPMYDGLSVPLASELDSDIIAETIVVTTSPEEECVDIVNDQMGRDETSEGVITDIADCQSNTVTVPGTESHDISQMSVDCVSVAATLQQLSSGGLLYAKGMLEDFTRLRDRLKKQEQRKNPEFRRRESAKAKIRMANRRNDPVLREIERRKDRERRALARQKTGVREKERKRDKIYKQRLRDKAKNIEDEDDKLISITDKTNPVTVNSGSCAAKSRIKSESQCVVNGLQQTTSTKVRDRIGEIASIRKLNVHNVKVVDDSTETIAVCAEKSNSSHALVDSIRTLEGHGLTNSEVDKVDAVTVGTHGDSKTNNHGDGGETVRIVGENGEEIVLCTGDAIDDKTAMFIENVIAKTETVHSV